MDDFEKFYKASVRFLSFRPRSEKELRDYLTKKKCDELTAKRILESLKRDKFINDEEFVRWWVEQRTLLKPKAWRVIVYELKQKGISKELIESVQSSGFKVQNDAESAMKLAEKKLRTIHDQTDRYKVKEKLGRYLAGKGFDWDTIKAVIDQILAK
jgi:regulatory protein